MAAAALGCGSPGCPLAPGTVPGQGEDGGGQAGERIVWAGRPVPAVAAAGVGGNVGPDEAEDGGEGKEAGVDPGRGGGTGGGGGRHVVDEQQRPGFLAGQVGGLAAQRAAGAADGLLQVQERDFNRPPLMPVKWKSFLAWRPVPGRY